MSRTTIMIILGIGASLMVGILLIAALLFARSYFVVTDHNISLVTPAPLVLDGTATETTPPETATPTATAVSPTAIPPATANAATVPAVQPNQTAACTNAATYVADVTISDDTHLQPGVTFVKTWRLKNSGTCTWNGRYQLVHAGGPTLGAVLETLALPADVSPGQTIDLSLTMLAPVMPGSYQSDWKLQPPQGTTFGVGRSSSPIWVKIVVVGQPSTTISGLIYQDANQSGVYDNGETLMGSRQVRLIPSTACQIQQEPQAVAFSDANGRYTLAGKFNGSTCVGVMADNGSLHDVVAVTVTTGQTVNNINLKWPSANLSLSGYLWSDTCLTNEVGEALAGDCVADGAGGYHADGMIQPTETYIAGVTIFLQLGSCANNNNVLVTAVTDGSGRYTFNSLQPATYCVSMNAVANGNADKLLPGDWTFPARGIWYHEITLQAGQGAFPVNFGWDYQLK